MSIYNKAGVVQIPSGYSAGTLYNVLPNTADGDFNATRGSTATRVNKDGLIESVAINEPRLDYPLLDGVVQDCPTLLLEPSRSNKITYSEGFNNWAAVFTTVNLNEIVSPDGSVNAAKLTDNSSSSTHRIQLSNTTSSSGSFCYSIFLKKGTLNTVALSVYSGTTAADSKFDLDNGTIVSTTNGTAEIQDYGNDWYRCIVKGTLASTSTTTYIYLKEKASYSGSSQFLYAWGAQLEQGSYLTSYIPTNGEVGGVTRSADVCNGAGTSAEFNDSEGVLFVEIAWINNDLDVNSDISLSDNSTGNRVLVTHTTTENQIEMFFRGTGSTISEFITLNDTSNFNRIALKYKSTNFDFYINGFKVFESNSVATVSNLFDLSFDNPSGGGTRNFYGKTKQLMTFKTALSDSELEQITSWTSFNEMAKGQLYTIE